MTRHLEDRRDRLSAVVDVLTLLVAAVVVAAVVAVTLVLAGSGA